MNDFLEWTRIAFRRQHGLAEAASPPCPVMATDALFRLACRHRVAGLWAAELVPAWKHYAYGQAQHAVRCALEAERLHENLAPVIPSIGLIKGPALACQAWPQSSLRHYDDLDFRCGKEDNDKLSSVLLSLGYKPEITDVNRQSHLWHFGWGIAFANDHGLRVEVNHRLFPLHYPVPARLEGASETIWTLLPLDQRSVRTMAPAAHLLLCSMHAIWHGWERLGWVADIAGLMVRCPGIVEQARQFAGETGFPHRALDTACRVASGLFGPLPGWPASPPDGDRVLGEAVCLLMRTEGPGGIRRARRLHNRLCNRRERIGSTLRRLMIPGDPDFQRWSLSAARRHWYWVLRPVRLLGVLVHRSLTGRLVTFYIHGKKKERGS